MIISTCIEFFKLRMHLNYSPKKMKQLQEKKLRKILRHAYLHSEFYRKSFEENGINLTNINTMPLDSFPAINKETFFSNFADILTDKKLSASLKMQSDLQGCNANLTTFSKQKCVHSSGSTGVPRFYTYDSKAWQTVIAGLLRGCLWNISFFKFLRMLTADVRILYIAATDGSYAGSTSAGDICSTFDKNTLFIDINEPLENWKAKINDFKPNFIAGYPSALKILGELKQKNEINFDETKVYQYVSCGEPLGYGLRQFLESQFKKTIVNFYGSSESLALGIEYEKEKGMLLFDDLNYIEVIDGKMYLTSLYNFTQPIIRYEFSDRLELINDAVFNEKPCFTRTKIVQSRQEDIMWFEKNSKKDFIHPLSVEGICIEGLLDYQFIRKGNEDFIMKIQIANEKKKLEILKELEVFFKKLLEDKQLQFVKYRIEVVDEIKADEKTGKKKLIIT